MKFNGLFSTALLGSICTSLAFAATPPKSATSTVKAKPGYFPIVIENDTNDASHIKQIYLLALAKTLGKDGTPCVLSFKPEIYGGNNAYVGSCTPVSDKMKNANTYSTDWMTLKKFKEATNGVLFYIPQVQSGRFYVSFNNKLYIPVAHNKAGAITGFQTPNLGNKSDKNYNILYDKFEYTYDSSQTFWANPTSVDFFAIPITLVPNSNDNKTKKPDSGPAIGVARDTLIGTMKNVLGTTFDHSKDQAWGNLIQKDESKKTNTILRVASPQIAQGFPLNTYLNRQPFNYINNLITYYQKNTLRIDASELANNKASPIYTFYAGQRKKDGKDSEAYKALFLFTGQVNSAGVFVFKNSPPSGVPAYTQITIDLKAARAAQGFFMPGQAPMTTPNKTVRSVIVKNLTAAFSVGLLPLPSNTLLSKAYYTGQPPHPPFYQANINNGKTSVGHGPFYDLYSKAIHKVIPITYAYAYDDVLGQDGTLTGKNGIAGDSSKTGPITIVLGDMSGAAIPNPYTKPGPVLPAIPLTNTGFKCTGSTCTLTATWKAPAGQRPGVSYFILPQHFNGDGAAHPVSSADIVSSQLPYYGSSITKATITVDAAQKVLNTPVQVFACSKTDPTFLCPTKTNDYAPGTSVGSVFLKPTS